MTSVLLSSLALLLLPSRASALHLGIDLSTQSATGVLLDDKLKLVQPACSVNFDEAFPEYETDAGMSVGDKGVVTSPVRMWLRALDRLFGELQATGKLDNVQAISCSGQQHGSVYWSERGLEALAAPPDDASGFDAALPADAFTVADSPIWADSSTSAECEAIEDAIAGGAAGVANLIGSRAYERFTGVQIAAVSARQPEAWQATAAVSLVSSFCASLLTGSLVPMDASDASGTLLMDLEKREWANEMLSCGAFPVGLKSKLGGEPIAAYEVVGCVSKLVSARWGLPASCRVVASSGDNPCAVAGLGLAEAGDLALSLGTSDTLLGVAKAADATPALEGHVMAHPCDPDAVFGMLCYKNGGAARQQVRDERCGGDWGAFGETIEAAPPGNGGVLGLHLPLPEITPIIPRAGIWHVDGDGAPVNPSALSDGEAVRSVVEGRFLSMRARGEAIGLKNAKRILATGGGSQSDAILQIAADVFNAPVLQADSPDAAAVGAARRAAHALALEKLSAGGDGGGGGGGNGEEVLGADELGALTVVQLKELLRGKGLPVSGRKADLVERLVSASGDGGGQPASKEESAGDAISRLSYRAFLEATMEGGADAGLTVVATPRADAAKVYSDALVDRYREFEDLVAAGKEGGVAAEEEREEEAETAAVQGAPAPAGFEWGATY